MNKKGALGLIIGIVVAVLVVGGISYFAFSGSSDDNIVNGTSGGGSGSGASSGGNSGSSSGSGEGSISSSWCSANRGTIETFKGRQACHTSTLSGEVYTYIIDKDYWVIQSQAYNYESHFINGKATELNCLSENPTILASCEQFKTTYCPTCP
ncbi:MAG: hypothetical protein Q7S56_04055 [Nanoarchaeota archaeon]|nr:hypothetical protein [Nanoarchaeota archaeon]